MNAAATCPCCRQALPVTADVMVDEDSGVIVRNGFVARPKTNEFRVFQALRTATPRMLSRDQLLDALYWRRSTDEEPDGKIIDVYISRLRKNLKPLDINIETVWGRGWRLRINSEAQP